MEKTTQDEMLKAFDANNAEGPDQFEQLRVAMIGKGVPAGEAVLVTDMLRKTMVDVADAIARNAKAMPVPLDLTFITAILQIIAHEYQHKADAALLAATFALGGRGIHLI